MSLFSFQRPPDWRPDNPRPTPIEILINIIAGYISPRAREERRQKAIGNPAERTIENQRIQRDAAHYQRGFPVAGHGEPEPANDPGGGRRRRRGRSI